MADATQQKNIVLQLKDVLTKSKYKIVIIIAMIIALIFFESVGDVSFSAWVNRITESPSDSSSWGFFALGGLFYLIMSFVFAATLLTKKIGWVNTMWQGLSVVWGIVWGVAYFKETPSVLDWTGFSVVLAGLIVLIFSKFVE